VTLFLLSACARTDGLGASASTAGPDPSGSAAPAAADTLVLRVEQTGGFAGTNQQIGKLPSVSVYGDGRVITPGPQIAIYPGPAMPNLQVQQAPSAIVDALVAKARAAGGGSAVDLGRPAVADGTTTRITADGRTIEVYALNEAQPGDAALTEAQRSARSKLVALVQELTELPTAKGMPQARPYEAPTVAVLAKPWVKPADDLPSHPAATPWPGPALPGPYLQAGVKVGCVTVTGDQAGKVLAAAGKANQNTPWTSGASTYSVTFRPLLPDESGCADLQAQR
jgi:hypothetical protein